MATRPQAMSGSVGAEAVSLVYPFLYSVVPWLVVLGVFLGVSWWIAGQKVSVAGWPVAACAASAAVGAAAAWGI